MVYGFIYPKKSAVFVVLFELPAVLISYVIICTITGGGQAETRVYRLTLAGSSPSSTNLSSNYHFFLWRQMLNKTNDYK